MEKKNHSYSLHTIFFLVIIEPNIGLNTLQVFLDDLFGLVEMIERETHRHILLEIKCVWSNPTSIKNGGNIAYIRDGDIYQIS